VDGPGGVLEEQDVDPLAEHGVDVEQVTGRIPSACALRNWPQLGPVLRGAGSRPARLRMSRTVLGGTRMPASASSPLIR
jgi:hypothetical protein